MASTGRTARAQIWALTSFTLSCFLVACAHAPDLPLRPDPAHATEVFVARDGTKLLAYHWPAIGAVKAAFVIVHGLKDYAARYDALAKRAAADGFDVWAFDLRGHGHSEGPRVAPDDWEDYVDDEDRFLKLVESRVPGKPVFLFGHSMGGAIAARTAEVHPVAGLILSGPALQIDAPPLLIAATRMSGFTTPKFPAFKLDNHDFSSDPANAAVMDKDPLISNDPAPASTAAGLVYGMHLIWRDVDRLTMPLLAMHGTADKLTAPAGSRALVRAAPAQDKTLRIYDGYFHDLLHEPNGRGEKVEADLIAWLDAHTGGAAVAAPPLYNGDLAGDPRGWTQSVSVEGGITSGTRGAGGLLVELARPRPMGWHGALALGYSNGVASALLQPLGLAVHTWPFAMGASGGGGVVHAAGTTDLVWSIGFWVEIENPYVHVRGFFEDFGRTNALLVYGASLRFPGDRDYWPHATAGVGPIVTVGGLENGGWFATAGLQLFGCD